MGANRESIQKESFSQSNSLLKLQRNMQNEM